MLKGRANETLRQSWGFSQDRTWIRQLNQIKHTELWLHFIISRSIIQKIIIIKKSTWATVLLTY